MSEAISETVSKKRGRPVAFEREYLDGLGEYFRRTSGRQLSRRSLQDKAYFLRCMRVLFGDDPAANIEEFPLLAYLADPTTGECRMTLMAKIGRIRDKSHLIETALGACFFRAGKDCDLEEIRKAWQVALAYMEARQ